MKRASVRPLAGAAKRVKTQDTAGADVIATAGAETFVDALEEDIAIGAARKKDILIDDYATDSSEDGHGVRRATKPNVNDDDDDDMFGGSAAAAAANSDDSDKEDRRHGRGARDPSFLESKDIVGQDFTTQREFMDIVDDPDIGKQENYDDDDDAALLEEEDSMDEEVGPLGRKRNAPKLDSFNMRAELDEGKFDAEGNYVRAPKDHKDSQDDWLKDVSRRDIEAARVAVEQRKQAEEEERAAQGESELTVAQLLAELIAFLERGETLLEALARNGSTSKTATTRHGQGRRGKQKKRPVDERVVRMTELANQLMAKSPIDVYDTAREGLCRAYERETGSALQQRPSDIAMQEEEEEEEEEEETVDTSRLWEFIYPADQHTVHGPYDAQTMKSWLQNDLLMTDDSNAMIRKVGETTFVDPNSVRFWQE